MKKIFAFLSLVAVILNGCSDDTPTTSASEAWSPKVGDYYKYNAYDIDSTNKRVPRGIKEWTFAKVGLEFAGRKDVSLIVQKWTDTNATVMVDTVYLSTPLDGKVFQYAALTPFLTRFAPIAPFSDSIPKTWLKIHDLKGQAGDTWVGQEASKFYVTFPAPAGRTSIEIKDTATNKGKVGVTVAGKSYVTSLHIDHRIMTTIQPSIVPTPIPLEDLNISYDGDIVNGIYGYKLQPKSMTVLGSVYFIPGYELELVEVKKAS